mmetsp:Transcript_27369/g.44069  ORF Transcript_27369/g.44069 Transcript_27369/m.44069 type:complete len:213 (-) Transcript_27369:2148-2786(-)
MDCNGGTSSACAGSGPAMAASATRACEAADRITFCGKALPFEASAAISSTLRKTSSLVQGASRSDASWESPSRATAPLEMPRRPPLTSLEPQKPRRGQSAQANIMGLSGCRHLVLALRVPSAVVSTFSPAYAATAILALLMTNLPSAAALLISLINCSPETFSSSINSLANSSSRNMLSRRSFMPRWYCSSTIRFTSSSTFCFKAWDMGGAP